MTRPDRETTLDAVRSGIDQLCHAMTRIDADTATPCAGWDALALVRHLEGMAGAYTLWTGSAVGGRVARMRVGDELHEYNALILSRLPMLPLDEHARRFAALAEDHLRLARATWDMPMMETPDGVVLRVGRHLGIGAVEWHVHGWDLARAAGDDHRPDDGALEVVVRAWDDVLAYAVGVERDPTGDPWDGLLVATGRTP